MKATRSVYVKQYTLTGGYDWVLTRQAKGLKIWQGSIAEASLKRCGYHEFYPHGQSGNKITYHDPSRVKLDEQGNPTRIKR